MRRDLVHPSMLGEVIAQYEVSLVLTKPQVTLGDGTVTPETALAAQTVRVSTESEVKPIQGVAGTTPVRRAIVYAETSVDIEEGYTFTLNGDRYRIADVLFFPNGKEAICVVNG